MKTVQIEYLSEELIEWTRAKYKIPKDDLVDMKKVVEALFLAIFPGQKYLGPKKSGNTCYCQTETESIEKVTLIFSGGCETGSFSTWILKVQGEMDVSERATAVLAQNNLLNPKKRIEEKKAEVQSDQQPPTKKGGWRMLGIVSGFILLGWFLLT